MKRTIPNRKAAVERKIRSEIKMPNLKIDKARDFKISEGLSTSSVKKREGLTLVLPKSLFSEPYCRFKVL